MTILVIAEHDGWSVSAATRHTMAAAAVVATFTGQEIHVLVAGCEARNAAEQATKIAGVSKVLLADAPQLEADLAESVEKTVSALVQDAASNYTHILVPATAADKNAMPRIAAKLGAEQISDITDVVSDDTFERVICAGDAIATVRSTDPVKVVTVRSTAFEPVPAEGGGASVQMINAAPDTNILQPVSRYEAGLNRAESTGTSIVFWGGRGRGRGENYANLLEPLADKLDAALGAARAEADARFVPNDYEVCETGGDRRFCADTVDV
jgi:electron transfer flavoprotein alpha subunit